LRFDFEMPKEKSKEKNKKTRTGTRTFNKTSFRFIGGLARSQRLVCRYAPSNRTLYKPRDLHGEVVVWSQKNQQILAQIVKANLNDPQPSQKQGTILLSVGKGVARFLVRKEELERYDFQAWIKVRKGIKRHYTVTQDDIERVIGQSLNQEDRKYIIEGHCDPDETYYG